MSGASSSYAKPSCRRLKNNRSRSAIRSRTLRLRMCFKMRILQKIVKFAATSRQFLPCDFPKKSSISPPSFPAVFAKAARRNFPLHLRPNFQNRNPSCTEFVKIKTKIPPRNSGTGFFYNAPQGLKPSGSNDTPSGMLTLGG